jgi:fatty-acyl-CoA synthase
MRLAIAATTFGDLVVRAAERAPERTAVALPGERLTAAELLERALAAARGLHALGVRRGDRVGVLMPNCADCVETLLGASLLGAVVVAINARYRSTELAYVAADAQLDVLVTTDLIAERIDFARLVAEAIAEVAQPPTCVLLGSGRGTPGFVDRERFAELADGVARGAVEHAREAVRLRDTAMMLYTSGTTAKPKACLLSHEALVRTGIAQARRYEITGDDVYWVPLPLFHMGGILPLMASLWAGARFVTAMSFEPGAALRQIAQERATIVFATFPAISGALIHHPDFAGTDLSAARLINHSAPPDVQRGVQRAFPQAKHVASYGCTELGGVVAVNRLDDPPEACATTCGTPWPGMELRVLDPATGLDAGVDVSGEIVGRGFGMFDGYHGDPERTAADVDDDGWFHTGDIGSIDADGRLAYLGRSKDMLKVGGENVSALEVESYLSTHPAVRLVVVVGAPDERLGEVCAAFVELAPGSRLEPEELVEFCRGRIASYKIPRHVRFVKTWPMSATKIQKFRLREQLLAELVRAP